MIRTLLSALLFLSMTSAMAADAPTASDKAWWWDDAFWEQGQIAPATNHAVETRWISYKSGDNTIPALLARPKD